MSPETKSKAQRRAEAQQRAAEQRAAEKRKKRTRLGLQIGAAVAVVALVVVLIVVLSSGGSGNPAATSPHVSNLESIPDSMRATWVQPPTTGQPGPEVVPLTTGPKLATLVNMASGQTVDGVQCNTSEKTVTHVHTHLTIFVNGHSRVIPYGVGIPGFQAEQTNNASPAGPGPFVVNGNCYYWLHVHSTDGIVHIESPSTTEIFTLGQFFDIWGVPLSTTQVGSATGKVTVFFTAPGKSPMLYTGNPRDMPLGDHYQIQLVVGSPIVAPVQITNWGGL